MCSIFKYQSCVGRNFDYEQSFKEELRIVERDELYNDFKIVGMCTGIEKNYPLFYDAMNEYGLVMGGLAFEGNAKYNSMIKGKCNVPSYDFILNTLGLFKSVKRVKTYLDCVNITDKNYSDKMPSSSLHWFIADENESIIVEQTRDGLNWYSGEVMTNNPPYKQQSMISQFYNTRVGNIGFDPNNYANYQTRGSETVGLQGDYTSEGRFARLTYLKGKLENSQSEFNPVSQSLNLCSSVAQIYGVTPVEDKYEYTIYSVIYDIQNKKVYLKFYDDLEVRNVYEEI